MKFSFVILVATSFILMSSGCNNHGPDCDAYGMQYNNETTEINSISAGVLNNETTIFGIKNSIGS